MKNKERKREEGTGGRRGTKVRDVNGTEGKQRIEKPRKGRVKVK